MPFGFLESSDLLIPLKLWYYVLHNGGLQHAVVFSRSDWHAWGSPGSYPHALKPGQSSQGPESPQSPQGLNGAQV